MSAAGAEPPATAGAGTGVEPGTGSGDGAAPRRPGGGRYRMPDFAGVALVDILANGVAMLIIVIVLTIAARSEREQRFAEQAEEVAAVMSHKFSTSLVLNSLAASPPARLHDYETSPLDQVYDPEQLPILELHRGFVREFYSGTVWGRRALLARANAMGAWLGGFSDLQRQRIRVDVYDVDQFYLAMAILREHGITVRHWHFVPGNLSLAEAARCPPGVAAKDCEGGALAAAPAKWPELGVEPPGRSGREDPDWPPSGLALGAGRGGGEAGPGARPMPEGVVPGTAGSSDAGFTGAGGGGLPGRRRGAERGQGFGPAQGQGRGGEEAAGLGSFPNEREGRGSGGARAARGPRPMDRPGAGEGAGTGPRMRFRIALPESVRRSLDGAPSANAGEPSLEGVLGVILHYLGGLQDALDGGASPSPRISGFARWFQHALRDPPRISEANRRIARELAEDVVLMVRLGGPAPRLDPLAIRPAPGEPGDDTVLVVETNRLLHVVEVGRHGPKDGGGSLPDVGRVALDLNAWPDVWRGLHLVLEPDSVLLMPTAPAEPEPPRWRAVAYVAPALDDFIIGFVFAGVDAEGKLRVQADANRVRIDGWALFTERPESWFGAKGWLVSFYAALAAGLLVLALRPAHARRARGIRRGAAAAAVLAAATAGIALLMRPLIHSFGADRVTVDLGIRPASSARARAVDDRVLETVESGSFGPELRLRLDRPARTVRLDPFLIDRCEVRQIDFERFARWRREGGAGAGPGGAAPPPPVSSSTGHRIAGRLDAPATGVDFFGASLYCEAVGGRLPWAEELEAAAAGKEGRLYAWGDEFDPAGWPFLDSDRNAARRCGSHPPSDSPQGVHDLNGNAMEWSAGSIAASAGASPRPAAHGAPASRRRARALYAINSAWLPISPTTRSHHLGFRCVYDRPWPRGAEEPPALPWGGRRARPAPVEGGGYPVGLPPDVRLARLAVILPDAQLRNARALLASGEPGGRRIEFGRCEVSRREYRRFLDDPLARAGLFANRREPASESYVPTDWTRQAEDLDLPVTGVSWWAADAFARWAGGRLPRVEEWRLASAGAAGRRRPWGDRYDPAAAVTGDPPGSGPEPCRGAGLRDATAGGVLHLAGNVSEWTSSIAVSGGNYAMWVQGGNWLLPGMETTLASFGRLVPLGHRSRAIGLRVVYDRTSGADGG